MYVYIYYIKEKHKYSKPNSFSSVPYVRTTTSHPGTTAAMHTVL